MFHICVEKTTGKTTHNNPVLTAVLIQYSTDKWGEAQYKLHFAYITK